MSKSALKAGPCSVGEMEVEFRRFEFQEYFTMLLPQSFQEDTGLSKRYSYFSDAADPLLGIAIRYARVGLMDNRDKIVGNYFGEDEECASTVGGEDTLILYRESEATGDKVGIYMLRFAIYVDYGVLIGCFNCPLPDAKAWHPVAIDMLRSLRKIKNKGYVAQ